MAPLAAVLLLATPDAGVHHSPRLGVMLVVDQLGSVDLETPATAVGSDFGGRLRTTCMRCARPSKRRAPTRPYGSAFTTRASPR